MLSPSASQPVPLRSAMKHSSSSPMVSPLNTPPSPHTSPRPIASDLPGTRPVFVRADSSNSSTVSPIHSPHTSTPHPPSIAPGYTPKVSFDTFENPAASMFSFTLSVQSDGYQRIRSTRVFLCASSPDESGKEALDWCLESLVQEGDELIVFRGIDEEDLDEKDHDVLRDEARDLMRQIQDKCATDDADRKVSIVLEYVAGRVTETLDRLIALYRPDSVVVGTRGRRPWQGMAMGFGMGSVSKYSLSHSPVPIIVVRPERKLRKAIEKRRADPKRGTHFDDDDVFPLSRPGSSHGAKRPGAVCI